MLIPGRRSEAPPLDLRLNRILASFDQVGYSPVVDRTAGASTDRTRRELRMSQIENRLRLRRRHCEERRQYLAALQHLAERLRADAGRLRGEIEQAMTAGDPSSGRLLAERRSKVEGSLAAVEAQLDSATAALAAAEQEMLRHERAFAARTENGHLAVGRAVRRLRRLRASPPASGNGG